MDGDSVLLEPLQFLTPFPAYITDVNLVDGIYEYTYTEQGFDANGNFITADSPRSGTQCRELNDKLITPPFYTVLRFRGIVDGDPWYDFFCCGDSSISDCPGCLFAILVSNENAVCDDDFNICLNGNIIANIVEGDTTCSPTTCRGNLILPASVSPLTPLITGLTLAPCIGVNIDLTYHYVAALDSVLTSNTVQVQSTKDNCCGNYGILRIARVCVKDGHVSLITVVDTVYDSINNSYTFTADCSTDSTEPGTCSPPSRTPCSESSSHSTQSSTMSSSGSGGGGCEPCAVPCEGGWLFFPDIIHLTFSAEDEPPGCGCDDAVTITLHQSGDVPGACWIGAGVGMCDASPIDVFIGVNCSNPTHLTVTIKDASTGNAIVVDIPPGAYSCNPLVISGGFVTPGGVGGIPAGCVYTFSIVE